MMKVSVQDDQLKTYKFRVHGVLTQSTTISDTTDEITLDIVCGSEQITVASTSSFVLDPLDLAVG